MGQSIRVTGESLHVFAARCGKHATLVGGVAAAPPPVSAPGQLTAGAVAAAHAAVAATGAAMGARIGSISRAAMGLTLSQVRGWDTNHLIDAADHWDRVATEWEASFDAGHRESLAPGGAWWGGRGAG